MNSLDSKNFSIINKLAGDYFSLSPDSFIVFNKALMEGRELPEEFAAILKDSPDGRARFKAPVTINEKIDDGWRLWKEKYSSFFQTNKISYEEYYNNRVNSEDSKVQKLSKFISKWFFENTKSFIEQMARYNTLRIIYSFLAANDISKEKFFSDVFEKEENIKAAVETCQAMKLSAKDGKLKIKFSVSKNEKSFSLYITLEKFSKIPYLESLINYYILKSNEEVGRVALPKSKDLEIVFSTNFADWFLCSTSESWSSCLSLTANYSSAYWAGLPGTITDKNRALVYLTDGKKKNYEGIEVDRIITRSWVLLMSNGKKDVLHFVNEYPGGFSLFGLTKEILKGFFENILSIKDLDEYYTSKYPFVGLFHSADQKAYIISSIFFDTTYLRFIKANKDECLFKHCVGGRGGSCYGFSKNTNRIENDYGHIDLDSSYNGEEDAGSGLEYLKNTGKTIADNIVTG